VRPARLPPQALKEAAATSAIAAWVSFIDGLFL
jgi:hypothetical protein